MKSTDKNTAPTLTTPAMAAIGRLDDEDGKKSAGGAGVKALEAFVVASLLRVSDAGQIQ
jgi:hypothetical protein